MATYPNIIIRYYASDIKLYIDSNVAYLVLPNTKSQIVGFFYLASTLPNTNELTSNTSILIICKTLRHMVSLVAKAETEGVFINTQIALPIRYIFECLVTYNYQYLSNLITSQKLALSTAIYSKNNQSLGIYNTTSLEIKKLSRR